MLKSKKENVNLRFGYERKIIKRDKKLPPLCPDYKPEEGSDYCEKASFCKNATYGFDSKPMGSCFGGTRGSEIVDRKKYQSA
jgi:hypothetical protein